MNEIAHCDDAISINRSINVRIDYFNNRLVDYNRLIVTALLCSVEWSIQSLIECIPALSLLAYLRYSLLCYAEC